MTPSFTKRPILLGLALGGVAGTEMKKPDHRAPKGAVSGSVVGGGCQFTRSGRSPLCVVRTPGSGRNLRQGGPGGTV
jgi:hypothetical protein